jgi:adenine/guanine phosphoribosyltransferase-like PRPP-binding protein
MKIAMNRPPYQAQLRNYSGSQLPRPPYATTYCTPLSDGSQVELPLEPLPGTDEAIVLLMSNQTPFEVEEKLAGLLTRAVLDLRPEVVVGVPTMGLDYARLVAAKLGHPHYVALGNSRKFWYEDAYSIPVQSVTSPGVTKKLYLDPALLTRVAGKRTLIVDDVIATGGTASAALKLLLNAGADVVGLGFVFSEGTPWKKVLGEIGPEWPGKVRVIGEIPRMVRAANGWEPLAGGGD